MGRLEGKSVIITGAGSGIGRAASLIFTREGAKLIAVDRAVGVKDTVDQVRKAGGTAEAVIADAGSEKDVIAYIDKAISTYGRLDAIWANAGVSGGLVPIAEQTVEHWQEILRINLIGAFLAIKYATPHMIKQGYGAILCTASVAGLKSGASGHPYAASKAGVIRLGQTHAFSCPATRRPTSTARRFRSMAASPPRCPIPASRSRFRGYCVPRLIIHTVNTAQKT